jgi:hypothetical protein
LISCCVKYAIFFRFSLLLRPTTLPSPHASELSTTVAGNAGWTRDDRRASRGPCRRGAIAGLGFNSRERFPHFAHFALPPRFGPHPLGETVKLRTISWIDSRHLALTERTADGLTITQVASDTKTITLVARANRNFDLAIFGAPGHAMNGKRSASPYHFWFVPRRVPSVLAPLSAPTFERNLAHHSMGEFSRR